MFRLEWKPKVFHEVLADQKWRDWCHWKQKVQWVKLWKCESQKNWPPRTYTFNRKWSWCGWEPWSGRRWSRGRPNGFDQWVRLEESAEQSKWSSDDDVSCWEWPEQGPSVCVTLWCVWMEIVCPDEYFFCWCLSYGRICSMGNTQSSDMCVKKPTNAMILGNLMKLT